VIWNALPVSVRDFGWGSAPDPAGGTYSAPPDTLAGYMGQTSKGKEGRKDGREGQGREVRREGDLLLRRGEGMEEGKGREEGKGVEKGEGRVSPPPQKKTKKQTSPMSITAFHSRLKAELFTTAYPNQHRHDRLFYIRRGEHDFAY